MTSYSKLRLIRRFSCHYVRKYCSKAQPDSNEIPSAKAPLSTSSLYIKRDDMANVQVLQLDLNLTKRLEDLQSLDANIKARGLQDKFNVHQLVADYEVYRRIMPDVEKIQRGIKENQENLELLNELRKNGELQAGDEKKLQFHLEQMRKFRKDMQNLKKCWWDSEETIVLKSLTLPVDLHASVPKQDEVLHNHGSKPELAFIPRSHYELGRKNKTLIFKSVSPTSYYLCGDLAHMELNLTDKFSTRLEQSGFIPFSCPDIVKTVVVEGCGFDFKQKNQVLTIEPRRTDLKLYAERESLTEEDDVLSTWHKWDVLQHLCGGASVPAFAAYMTRLNFKSKSLPIRFFSVGRNYKPVTSTKDKEPTLLNTCQSTCIEIFAAAANELQSDDVYKTMVFLIWEIAKQLQLPVRLVNVGCTNLRHSEAARTDVEVWMPSCQTYTKLCSVALWGDFISRRLMMKHNENHRDFFNNNYLHTVHGTFLNVPVLLAAFMENFQSENGTYTLPELHLPSTL